ncbi:hypothetical protein [Brunnivagina elsteri]|uniref:hypothetical protein n=1 Tax=Brunnivagina elsteri TaxID=1247191 RepID=UPI0011778D02|nr:hypothetical protein [Calothrix elsteri]
MPINCKIQHGDFSKAIGDRSPNNCSYRNGQASYVGEGCSSLRKPLRFAALPTPHSRQGSTLLPCPRTPKGTIVTA